MDELFDTWMDQGPTVAPSRIAEATRAEIRTTHQRRATWWPVRRPMTMNTTLRFAVAAAVVTLAALVGFTFLNNQIGTEPTPTPNPSESASGPLPAGLNHPFIGEPRSIPGLTSDPAAAILNFDGTTFRFGTGQRDILISEAAVTDSGQLILTTVVTRDGCNAGDEGLYDFSFSPGASHMTITGTDDCAARLAALVGTWQTSDCRNEDNFCLGNLEAGSYSSQYFEPRPLGAWAPRFGALTFTVPEGWAATNDFPENYSLETQAAYATDTPGADGCSDCPDGIGVWAAPDGGGPRLQRSSGPGRRHFRGRDRRMGWARPRARHDAIVHDDRRSTRNRARRGGSGGPGRHLWRGRRSAVLWRLANRGSGRRQAANDPPRSRWRRYGADRHRHGRSG